MGHETLTWKSWMFIHTCSYNHQYCHLASFIPLSRNPLRNRHWIKKNSPVSNYRPISNLSLISKTIEHVVKSRLIDHLTSNSLLNSHQSAYCKHHSIKTALLYIHDHLVSAIGSQKVSFGIHGSVLRWFKSYLSSRWFRVKCETDLSSWHTSSCGVPQGSVW